MNTFEIDTTPTTQKSMTRRGFAMFSAAAILAASGGSLALKSTMAREVEPGDDHGGHGNDNAPGDNHGGGRHGRHGGHK